MAARVAKIELYWTFVATGGNRLDPVGHYVVNWRMKAANGEVLCQCTQGFQDKTDAMRNVQAVAGVMHGDVDKVRIVGPGKKPS